MYIYIYIYIYICVWCCMYRRYFGTYSVWYIRVSRCTHLFVSHHKILHMIHITLWCMYHMESEDVVTLCIHKYTYINIYLYT